MSAADGADAPPAGSVLPAGQQPWQQIPSFDPQTTDIQVYARKLQFLRDIWPQEHLAQLAPRAALQVQGVAFQKVARLDTEKLRGESGVKYLVESLGGSWGKLASEEKFSLFEKGLLPYGPKIDSYLARHDASFEDMMAKGVSMEEVQAYVMIRQSQLSSEDRKRIVVETEGNLTYAGARKSLRLLGHRFFQDFQDRTCDVNMVDNSDESALWTMETEVFDDEAMVQALHDAGDEDAACIMDFENTVIEAVQESPELASCYHTYLEARTRLRERAKYRGF